MWTSTERLERQITLSHRQFIYSWTALFHEYLWEHNATSTTSVHHLLQKGFRSARPLLLELFHVHLLFLLLLIVSPQQWETVQGHTHAARYVYPARRRTRDCLRPSEHKRQTQRHRSPNDRQPGSGDRSFSESRAHFPSGELSPALGAGPGAGKHEGSRRGEEHVRGASFQSVVVGGR